MRGTLVRSRYVVAALACCGAVAPTGADAAPPEASFWAPQPVPAQTDRARRALAHALAARGIALDDLVVPSAERASLRPALARAIDDYGAMRIAAAVDALVALAGECARTGGGDLDRRGLADVFLYLGLAQQELGHNDLAWDAFVASVRIDPTRTLDPARVPPRAAATFHRAVAEQAKSPQVELDVHLPEHARLRLDGDIPSLDGAPLRIAPGTHYVQVEREGDEPWARTLTAAPPRATLAPVLDAQLPPVLAALEPPQGEKLLGAIYRPTGDAPLRLLVRSRTAEGRLGEASDLIDGDLERRAAALLDTVLGPLPVAAIVARAPASKPLVRRWWLWTAIGLGVAALSIGLPVGLTRGHHDPRGTVGGGLVPLQ